MFPKGLYRSACFYKNEKPSHALTNCLTIEDLLGSSRRNLYYMTKIFISNGSYHEAGKLLSQQIWMMKQRMTLDSNFRSPAKREIVGEAESSTKETRH